MRLKGEDIIFLATGVGPVNAALATGYTLGLTYNDQKIKAVLLTGMAGAFDLNLTPLCSLWQVTEEIWPEYGLHDGVRVTAKAFSFPQWVKGKEQIYDSVFLAGPEQLDPALKELWPTCTSLTVAGVSASFARRDALWTTYHARLENMEGFAVAYSAMRAEIPCIEIRVVSNKVGPRSREEKDFEGALKAMGSILPQLNLI